MSGPASPPEDEPEEPSRSKPRGTVYDLTAHLPRGAADTLPFRMPAEWEPHRATWLCWPHNPETWPEHLAAAESEFAGIVRALAASEPVRLVVKSESHRDHVAARLGDTSAVEFFVAPTNDSWIRDTGPTFVRDATGALRAIDWTFDAWGGKYPPWDHDDALASRIAAWTDTPRVRPSLCLEGGALEVDGAGTLLATPSSLLPPARATNPAKAELRRALEALLGIETWIEIEATLPGDDTDGHIDNLARFVAPGRVVCAIALDPRHPSHAELAHARATLEAAHDAQGRKLEVTPLPLPAPIDDGHGRLLPASHLNFYVANRAVLVPVFGGKSDTIALDHLAAFFPDRQIAPVACGNLVRGFGAVHCLTQQEPE